MIILKKLIWDNCFSYGRMNYLKLDNEVLTQLVGTNGTGKTSIALMIQEVLFGKNIKNIKKQDIANNKSGQKGYYINLWFEKDGIDYIVELDRRTSLKFRLYKNGEDISSHTSLNTYKTLAKIIGISDFKVFCQLIYQHSTDSLDFLTATDMNRKKFLISLLQLDKYLKLHDLFKEKTSENNRLVATVEGSVLVIEKWLGNHKDVDLVKQELLEVDPIDPDWYLRKASYENKIANINQINKKIVTNLQYMEELFNLKAYLYMGTAPAVPKISVQELRAQVRVIESHYEFYQKNIDGLDLSEICPTCSQEVDNSQQMIIFNNQVKLREEEKEKMGKLWLEIPKAEAIETEIKDIEKEKAEFVRLNQLIQKDLDTKTLDKNVLILKLRDISLLILKAEEGVKSTEKENLKISAHNSKVDVVVSQLDKMKKDLREANTDLMEKENLSTILEILKRTFGTNGLVSYKIESSVKELEKKINKYLADLTHFQMYFKLAGEKLNLEIVDDKNNTMSIANLSSGERARLNLATILAIRNILSALTNTKINLLFLDEITGALDNDGKEKFTEILLKENLNTFFVAHEWAHPLVPKINIVKENGISRIEND